MVYYKSAVDFTINNHTPLVRSKTKPVRCDKICKVKSIFLAVFVPDLHSRPFSGKERTNVSFAVAFTYVVVQIPGRLR